MTFDEMVAGVLQLFPEALFHEGEDLEVVISTGCKLVNNELVPMEGI